MNLPDPTLTPAYIVAVITEIVGLFVTQGIIDNGVAKFITGLAVVLVPLVLVAVHAAVKSRAHSARVHYAAVQNAATLNATVPPA